MFETLLAESSGIEIDSNRIENLLRCGANDFSSRLVGSADRIISSGRLR